MASRASQAERPAAGTSDRMEEHSCVADRKVVGLREDELIRLQQHISTGGLQLAVQEGLQRSGDYPEHTVCFEYSAVDLREVDRSTEVPALPRECMQNPGVVG